jgi:pimeloyl-ACP methyl ester carboxylesterase
MTAQHSPHCATASVAATSIELRRASGGTLAAAALAALLGVASAGGAANEPAAAAPRLHLDACSVPGVERVRCGTFRVPENRAQPQKRSIDLNVVILAAARVEHEPDALFILQGGPGQGATTLADFYAETFAGLRDTRDIVLVDQRGTGASNPLACRLGGSKADPGGYLGDMFPVDLVRECRAELEQRADLTQYTTPIAMTDLDELRAALGYERINLYGTSYGTRAAFVYLRAHPERVRAMTLKGVVPMSGVIPVSFAEDSQRALDLLFDDCTADAACAGAYPRLRAEFASIVDGLRRAPRRVSVERNGGAPVEHELTLGPFAAVVRSLLQSTSTSKDLPLIIHDAAQGNWTPFTRIAVALRAEAARGLQTGMLFSVTCTEDAPFIEGVRDTRQESASYLGDYWTRSLLAACGEWPRGRVPADYRNAVPSDVPTLLVSGYLDSAAPPRWAEEAARSLPNSRQIVVRYGSHSFSGLAGCVDIIMTKFIERGSARELDDACVRTIRRPPFTLPAGASPQNEQS